MINYVIVRYIFLICISYTAKLFEFQIYYSKIFILLKEIIIFIIFLIVGVALNY